MRLTGQSLHTIIYTHAVCIIDPWARELKTCGGGDWVGRALLRWWLGWVVVHSREPVQRTDGRSLLGRARQAGWDTTDGSATCLCSVVVRGVDALIGQCACAQQTHPSDPADGQQHLMSSARRDDCHRCDVRVVNGMLYRRG